MLEARREALREVCRLFGGIRAISRDAGLNSGNLGRWFQGYPALSEAKVADFLNAVGLPGGLPRRDMVHEWKMSGVNLGDYASAFRLFFPLGAEVVSATWSQSGFREVVRRVKNFEKTPEVFAITDGRVKAVIRLPSNLLLQKGNMGDVLTWRNGSRENSLLNVEKGDPAWCEGPLSIEEFDQGWGTVAGYEPTAHDVLAVIQEEGISFAEAINRLRSSNE